MRIIIESKPTDMSYADAMLAVSLYVEHNETKSRHEPTWFLDPATHDYSIRPTPKNTGTKTVVKRENMLNLYTHVSCRVTKKSYIFSVRHATR